MSSKKKNNSNNNNNNNNNGKVVTKSDGSVTTMVPQNQQVIVDKVRSLLLETSGRTTKEEQKLHFKLLFELTNQLITMSPSNHHYKELKAVSIFSLVDNCNLPPQLAVSKLEEAVQLAPNVAFIKERLLALRHLHNIPSSTPLNKNDNELFQNGNKKLMATQLFSKAIESQMKGDLNMSFHFSLAAHENDPDNKDINLHLGNLYAKQGKIPHANKHIDLAIKGKPVMYDAHIEKANLQQKEGDTINAVKRLKLIATAAESTRAQKKSALLLKIFYMNYVEQYNINNNNEIYEESIQYHKFLNITPFSYSNEKLKAYRKQSPIKIGYLSSHFCEHPIAYFMDGIIKCHNRETFEIHIFSLGSQVDAYTKRFVGYVGEKNFHSIRGKSCKDIAETIRNLEITILTCLDIHTESDGEIASYRPAPIIVNYLGYPNTAGIPNIVQYRITDEHADPLDTKQLWTEKLIRMPSTFLCFDASHITQNHPVSPIAPFEKNDYITFGCYNTLSKIQMGTWRVWKNILERLPTARIVVKAPLFIVESARDEYLRKITQETGIDSSRVILKTYSMETTSHYDSYNDMDISLDPFPYNGTTTSMDSLWMGVPFITMTGETHVHNVGRSILVNAGLNDLVANNPEEYVNAAVRLANDKDRIKHLRNNLREALHKSPLSKPKQFTIDLEDKYILMFNDIL